MQRRFRDRDLKVDFASRVVLTNPDDLRCTRALPCLPLFCLPLLPPFPTFLPLSLLPPFPTTTPRVRHFASARIAFISFRFPLGFPRTFFQFNEARLKPFLVVLRRFPHRELRDEDSGHRFFTRLSATALAPRHLVVFISNAGVHFDSRNTKRLVPTGLLPSQRRYTSCETAEPRRELGTRRVLAFDPELYVPHHIARVVRRDRCRPARRNARRSVREDERDDGNEPYRFDRGAVVFEVREHGVVGHREESTRNLAKASEDVTRRGGVLPVLEPRTKLSARVEERNVVERPNVVRRELHDRVVQ